MPTHENDPAAVPPATNATQVLAEIRHGDDSAAARLLPLVYDQLRALAGKYFQAQPANHTLEPTALVHEAFLKLVDRDGADWKDRAHFVATCAVAMRSILTDHARRKASAKRGGGWDRVTLSGLRTPSGRDQGLVDVLALDEVLGELAALNARQARVVEYRIFGGLTTREIAFKLDVSSSTIESDWSMARAWLSMRLADPSREQASPGG